MVRRQRQRVAVSRTRSTNKLDVGGGKDRREAPVARHPASPSWSSRMRLARPSARRTSRAHSAGRRAGATPTERALVQLLARERQLAAASAAADRGGARVRRAAEGVPGVLGGGGCGFRVSRRCARANQPARPEACLRPPAARPRGTRATRWSPGKGPSAAPGRGRGGAARARRAASCARAGSAPANVASRARATSGRGAVPRGGARRFGVSAERKTERSAGNSDRRDGAPPRD